MDQIMGWVNDLLQKRIVEQVQSNKSVVHGWPAPKKQSIFGEITVQIQSAVLEFNGAQGSQFLVKANGNSIVTVLPKQSPLSTAVIEIDNRGTISMTCPPAGLGIGRRGTFKEKHGLIVSVGDFVGQPQPSGEPMTPEEFSRFVLEAILFPTIN